MGALPGCGPVEFWVQPLIIQGSRSCRLWREIGKTATFEDTVLILTNVYLRFEADRPTIYIIVILVLAYVPAIGRGLRTADVHMFWDERLARTGVVFAESGGGVEARVRPVEVSHWNFVERVGRMGNEAWLVGKRSWVGEEKSVQLSRF